MLTRRRFLAGLGGLGAVVPLNGLVAPWRPTGGNTRQVSRAIAAGVAFLTAAQPAGQYNPTLGLLREAPTAAPCKYWLFNDNALAGHLLARLRHPLARTILATLTAYERERNGLHEVLWGKRVGDSLDWCPHTHYYETFPANPDLDPGSFACPDPSTPLLANEMRLGVPMLDWQEYADLAMYGALNQNLLRERRRARATFAKAMADLFVWQAGGFVDKAYQEASGYLTYKVGLALHTGQVLGALTLRERGRLVEILLAQQESSLPGKTGGFYTHYGQLGPRTADVNTETTALVLWGLAT